MVVLSSFGMSVLELALILLHFQDSILKLRAEQRLSSNLQSKAMELGVGQQEGSRY